MADPNAAAAAGGPPVEGGEAAAGKPKNKRLEMAQAQVDEVVDIMKVNVEKILVRDQKLSALDERADALEEGASQFEKSAATMKNKYWWKDMKMTIILGALVVGVVGFIFYYLTK